MVRYAAGTATLADLERQAEGNLRHSFAVVGLLEDTSTFFEMISARVGYMNTSLNPAVIGGDHKSRNDTAIFRCKTMFADPAVQEKMMRMCPELASLYRLYKVAVEVNRFQLEELRTCSDLPLGRNGTTAMT